jgi:hypothetical protein
MARIRVPKISLPTISPQEKSFFVRFRLVSEDKNRFSYWSPIFQVADTVDYPKVPIIVEQAGTPPLEKVTVTWGTVDGVSSYDVWVQWSPPASAISISNASNPSGELVTYTTEVNHNLSEGQLISISGVSPLAYNLTDVLVDSVPSSTTFTVRSSASGTFSSGEGSGIFAWVYYGRVVENSISLFKPESDPEHETILVRVQVAADPIGHYEDFRIAEFPTPES